VAEESPVDLSAEAQAEPSREGSAGITRCLAVWRLSGAAHRTSMSWHGLRRAAQQLHEADVLPLANLESRSDWSILKQVEIRPNARGLSRTLGGAGLQRFYFGEISPRASSESPYEQSVVHIARSGQQRPGLR